MISRQKEKGSNKACVEFGSMSSPLFKNWLIVYQCIIYVEGLCSSNFIHSTKSHFVFMSSTCNFKVSSSQTHSTSLFSCDIAMNTMICTQVNR